MIEQPPPTSGNTVAPGNIQKVDYYHQHKCFICQEQAQAKNKRWGHYYCHFCNRKYHLTCAIHEVNQHSQKIGPCCQLKRPCEFCKIDIEVPMDSYKCTICYRPAHRHCYLELLNGFLPKLSPEQKQDAVFSYASYVCQACLARNKVIKFKKTQRFFKFGLWTYVQKMAVFVQIKYTSPIHHGWFFEHYVRDAYQELLKETSSTVDNQKKVFDPKYLIQSSKIERILAVRHNYRVTPENAFEILRNRERIANLILGHPDNFKFYVKWYHSSYSTATWQDQLTVRYCSPQVIEKYLCKEQSLRKDRTLKYSFLSLEEKQSILKKARKNNNRSTNKMLQYTPIYSVELIIDQGEPQKIAVICDYLSHRYVIDHLPQPTIILTLYPEKWEKHLKKETPYIHYVCFKGCPRSLSILKTIQFLQHKPNFDLFIISYPLFVKQKDFLFSFIPNTAMYIFDDFTNYQFMSQFESQHTPQQFLIKRYIILVNPDNPSNIYSEEFRRYEKTSYSDRLLQIAKNLCYVFESDYIIQHYLNWSKIRIFHKRCFSQKYQFVLDAYLSGQPIDEIKRQVLLFHILAHGLNEATIDSLYSQLMQPYATEFSLTSQQANKRFKAYIQSFKIALIHCQDWKVGPTISKHFFFNQPAQFVFTRLNRLNRLRYVLNIPEFIINIKVPQEDIISRKVVPLAGWSAEDDRVLAYLILEVGYSRWQQILQSKSWKKYYGQNDGTEITFEDYIRSRSKEVNPLSFVQYRTSLIYKQLNQDF